MTLLCAMSLVVTFVVSVACLRDTVSVQEALISTDDAAFQLRYDR
jgi:hypothetical protein